MAVSSSVGRVTLGKGLQRLQPLESRSPAPWPSGSEQPAWFWSLAFVFLRSGQGLRGLEHGLWVHCPSLKCDDRDCLPGERNPKAQEDRRAARSSMEQCRSAGERRGLRGWGSSGEASPAAAMGGCWGGTEGPLWLPSVVNRVLKPTQDAVELGAESTRVQQRK